MTFQYIPSPPPTGLTQIDAGLTGLNKSNPISPVKSSQSGASPVATGLVVCTKKKSYLFSPASPVFFRHQSPTASEPEETLSKVMPLGRLDCNKLANLLESEDFNDGHHR